MSFFSCSDSEPYFSRDGGKLGGTYLKAKYISYTDETFTTKSHIVGSDEHLGILGKILTCVLYVYEHWYVFYNILKYAWNRSFLLHSDVFASEMAYQKKNM